MAWPQRRLGDLLQITSSKRVFQSEWKSRGIPFYRAREIVRLQEQGFVDNDLFIAEDHYESLVRQTGAPEPGDLLVTGVGTLGRTYLVRPGDRFYFKDGNIIWLKRSDSIDPHFLEQLYKTPQVKSQIEGESAGTTVGTYTITNAKNTVVVVPDLAIQRAIAEALGAADDLIATLERLIAKKRAIRRGMAQQLLTGRTRLQGFADQWEHVALGDVASFSKGAGLPKSALVANGPVPCVHYGELFIHYGPEIRMVSSRTVPSGRAVVSEDLDVLMPTSDVTPRGLAKASAIYGKGVILGGDILIIRPDKSRLHGPFLAHAIRQDASQVLQLVRGSTVYHLYASDMRNFSVAIPTVNEQKAISDVLRDADEEIAALHARIAKARAVKVGMMQQLLTGRARLPVVVAS